MIVNVEMKKNNETVNFEIYIAKKDMPKVGEVIQVFGSGLYCQLGTQFLTVESVEKKSIKGSSLKLKFATMDSDTTERILKETKQIG